jgi:hypothetical protein
MLFNLRKLDPTIHHKWLRLLAKLKLEDIQRVPIKLEDIKRDSIPKGPLRRS